jgi:hypothetical protein
MEERQAQPIDGGGCLRIRPPQLGGRLHRTLLLPKKLYRCPVRGLLSQYDFLFHGASGRLKVMGLGLKHRIVWVL